MLNVYENSPVDLHALLLRDAALHTMSPAFDRAALSWRLRGWQARQQRTRRSLPLLLPALAARVVQRRVVVQPATGTPRVEGRSFNQLT